MSAMSGGRPPATAVERIVGRLLPSDLYFTLTFGNFLLNAEITSANCFAPDDDVQMPSKTIVPETALAPAGFAWLLVRAAARLAVSSASAAATRTKAMRVRLMQVLSSMVGRRCR